MRFRWGFVANAKPVIYGDDLPPDYLRVMGGEFGKGVMGLWPEGHEGIEICIATAFIPEFQTPLCRRRNPRTPELNSGAFSK